MNWPKHLAKQCCIAVLLLDVLPSQKNLMTDKGFNLLDECAARCEHLYPQKEACISSSRRSSKIYTSGTIANSQRMVTEINESGAVAKNEI